jgi:Flp pilus assembly protein TadD
VQPNGGTPDAARENLASLRRSVEHDDSLPRIIGRYQQFIARTNDPAVAEMAKQDLAVWQQRKDAGLTKYGTQWVNDTELAKLKVQTLQKADLARRQIKAEHFNEADSTLNQVLSEDPKLATALYLKGLLQYRIDQLPPARKSFEQVNQLVPNHSPTLNNLAIVLARQNQASASLGMFDQAMLQSPRNRQVLDNVAESLYALPDEARGTQIAQRVARHFTEQDVDLQKELDKQGLHRWGATWVTTAQLDTLKVAERAVKDKLDQLSADFDATKVRINTIDRNIEDNERSMRNLEASSYVRDVNGNIYQSVLPATYYQMQDDNNKLKRDRDQLYASLEQLRTQARQVNQDLPVPKYTGIQKMFDADSAPTIAPKGGVTIPTTQAAG